MNRALIGVAVTLAASVALAPSAGLAQHFHGQMGGGHATGGRPFVSRPFPARPFVTQPLVSPFATQPFVSPFPAQPFVPQHVSPRPFAPNKFPGHRFFPHHFARSFVPFGFAPYAQSTAIYAPPIYYDPSSYYDQPAPYDAPDYYSPVSSSVSLAPPPPPAPNVIQYATGRYELRGDGMTTPYTWVWIPNPPPAPPTEAPTPGEPSSRRHGELYRWTDADGVLHVTDRLEAVPPQYRQQAKPFS